MDKVFLGELGLILLLIFFAIIILPLLLGMFVASLFSLTGWDYYQGVFLIAIVIWVSFGIYYYKGL